MNWEILNKISEGSFSNVYKVKHSKTGEIAAFKLIHQALHNVNEKRRFKQSFISTSKISHINCVKMKEWVETKDKIGFVMEFVDGKPITTLLENSIYKTNNFKKLIPLFIQISKGLGELHQHKLIHRDLKPANILISKDGIVKLLDFDFIKIENKISKTMNGSFIGTINYASPEQCINASKIDLRSDLYSLGVIFYEMITGELPFDGESFTEIALGHIQTPLIPPIDKINNLHRDIDKIIRKLLEKDPKNRYSSTRELIKNLKKIIGMETSKSGKNFLLTPNFVGRKKSIKKLEDVYNEISQNSSKSIIIEGESGIGKSRLWQEFRLNLEMKQIPIIDIQCRKSGGIYDPLKGIILKMIKLLKIDSEFDQIKVFGELAWDLAKIAPEIKDLDFLNRIEKIAELKGKNAELRLFEAITNLIINYINLKHQPKKNSGLVIYIEDLHWCDEPIYRWFSYAARNFKKHSILLIASVRTESIKSDLKNIIDNLKTENLIEICKLKPLSRSEILEMLISMLLTNIDNEFVEKIYKLTEGNPLYIEKIIHHLFDNKKIEIKKDKLLYKKDFLSNYKSETVEDIISRRLNRLEKKNRWLLQAAAISGQVFGFDELINIFDYGESKIMNYLEKSRLMNLIEFDKIDNEYKFCHDSTREILLSEVDINRKKKYHKLIAEKIENEGLNIKISKDRLKYFEGKIEDLANHFFSAGIFNKAKKYCAKAGDMTGNKYAYEKTISYYKKVIKIAKIENDFESEIEYHIKKATICTKIGNWDKAKRIGLKALKLSENNNYKKGISKANNFLGWLFYLKSDLDEAIKYLTKGLKINKELDDKKEIAKIFRIFGNIYIIKGNYEKGMEYSRKDLKICKETEDEKEIANALMNIGIVYRSTGNYQKAINCFKKTLKIYQKEKDICRIASVCGNLGIVYDFLYQPEKAMVNYNKQLKISKKIRDKKGVSSATGNIGNLFYDQGNYKKALECYEKMLKNDKELGDNLGEVVAMENIGWIYNLLGDFKKAKEYFKKKLKISEKFDLTTNIASSYGDIGTVYYCEENYDKAIEYYNKAFKIFIKLKKIYPFSFYLIKKVESLIEKNSFQEARNLIDENINIIGKVLKEEVYEVKILSAKIDFALGQKKEAIIELKGLLKEEDDDEKKVYINYTLFEIEKYDNTYKESKKSIIHAKKALKLYKNIIKKKPQFIYKRRIKELESVLEKFSNKDGKINNINSDLINSLVRFMNPDSAYNELLHFLTVDRNADCAILIIRKEDERIKGIDKEIFNIYNNQYIIKAISKKTNKEDMDFSRNILYEVLEKNDIKIIPNAIEIKDLKNKPSIIGKAFLSVIALPLKNSKGEIIAALYLDRREIIKKPFTEEDIDAVKGIAEIITPILIEQEKARQVKLLSEIQNLGLFIGNSKKMQELYDKIEKIAKVDMTVYIYGETGTGKELVAKALYQLSERSIYPFIAINCSTIPGELAETELFGHEKGAFTGAEASKKGKFELADKGILFLDEIAELPLQMQAKFLRVLQNNEIWKVGGKKAESVDVRVIVSTHKDLKEEIKKGRFREDLYHRLNILKIEVPPLRERKEDIPLLVYQFLKKFSKKSKKNITGFTASAIEALQSQNWSGNVRELENVIAKAVVNHIGDKPIDFCDIFPDSTRKQIKQILNLENKSLQNMLDSYEEEIVKTILLKHKWNISKTAKELKIDRKRLYRIIDKNNLKQN